MQRKRSQHTSKHPDNEWKDDLERAQQLLTGILKKQWAARETVKQANGMDSVARAVRERWIASLEATKRQAAAELREGVQTETTSASESNFGG